MENEEVMLEEEAPEAPESGADPGEVARGFLEELLETMGLEATVRVSPDGGDGYRLEMEGRELSTVIGRQGSTLGAIQYLLTLVVRKQTGARVRITLDAEGYRSRHEETLREVAYHWAERVKETGQECVLDPMSAFDRRIVHNALADDPDVFTYSEGEEPERSVVISPRAAGADESGDAAED